MNLRESVTPVILMGGGMPEDYARATGVQHTAQLTLNGETILDRVRDALLKAGFKHKAIIVSRNAQVDIDHTPCRDQGSLPANLLKALELSPTDRIMTWATDTPLVDSAAIEEFLTSVEVLEKERRKPYDFIYPVCRVSRCDELVPRMRHTSMEFKAGDTYTGGNFMIVSKRLLQYRSLVTKVLEARKDKKKLTGAILGFAATRPHRFATALPYLPTIKAGMKKKEYMVSGRPVIKPVGTRAIPFDKVGKIVSALTGLQCATVEVNPKLACDADKLEDWLLIKQQFEYVSAVH